LKNRAHIPSDKTSEISHAAASYTLRREALRREASYNQIPVSQPKHGRSVCRSLNEAFYRGQREKNGAGNQNSGQSKANGTKIMTGAFQAAIVRKSL
jgi:hypothetical protein